MDSLCLNFGFFLFFFSVILSSVSSLPGQSFTPRDTDTAPQWPQAGAAKVLAHPLEGYCHLDAILRLDVDADAVAACVSAAKASASGQANEQDDEYNQNENGDGEETELGQPVGQQHVVP